MPNQITIEDSSIKEDLNYLINFLSDNEDCENPHEYFIGEVFYKDGKPITPEPNVYKLYNLTMEIENDIVISTDSEDKLYEVESSLPLLSFCVKSVVYIGFQNTENKITISFNDGYINIFY